MKLAFIVPWYGPQATGGAETAVRHAAEALYHRAGLDVEVLTTCSREFNSDWGVDELLEGLDEVNGVPVRRFPVRPRDTRLFDPINARLMADQPITAGEERVFIREMINSEALCEFVRTHSEEYFFFFTPYMFGTTYEGSAIAPDRSALIPALHDERYAYLGIYAAMFRRVRGVVFHSRAEMELGRRLYVMRPGAAAVIPAGIEARGEGDGGRFRARHGLGDYLLYVGRKEAGKNLPLLLDFFAQYRKRVASDLKLVLLGKGPITAPADLRNAVLDLGFVPEQEKWDAYAGALALCQPSVHESFSLVMMEAWLAGTPSLVHGRCAVTREYCAESNGGLYFVDKAEFAAAIDLLVQQPAVGAALGRQGREYVRRHFTWDVVIARYLDSLRRWGVEPADLRRPGAPPVHVVRARPAAAVHQLVAAFRPGDAISNYALVLRGVFRSWGLDSEIFAPDVSPDAAGILPLRALAGRTAPDDVLVYHHSIYSAAAETYVDAHARRVLVYHNITPPEYFAGSNRLLEGLVLRGRAWLPMLIRASHRIFADSNFNAEELRGRSATCHVVPLLIDFSRLADLAPDEGVLHRYADGRTNLLFVGRVVGNKRQEDVVRVFRAYRALNPRSRLLLVGSCEDDGGAYAERVRDQVAQYELTDSVELTGRVSDAQLVAFYRTARAFVCMSEHEGFCIPLVEAMYFGVPVVAYAAAAVPETLGGGGVLIDHKDYRAIARVIDRLVRDEELRGQVVEAQRRRLKDFAPETVVATLKLHFEDLLKGTA